MWRADGREPFYLGMDNRNLFGAGDARTIIRAWRANTVVSVRWSALNNPRWRFHVSPDGQRFFMPVPAAETGTTPITVVVNWTAALSKVP